MAILSLGHAQPLASLAICEENNSKALHVSLSLAKAPVRLSLSLPLSNRLSWWNDPKGQQWSLYSSFRTSWHDWTFVHDNVCKLQSHNTHLIQHYAEHCGELASHLIQREWCNYHSRNMSWLQMCQWMELLFICQSPKCISYREKCSILRQGTTLLQESFLTDIGYWSNLPSVLRLQDEKHISEGRREAMN